MSAKSRKELPPLKRKEVQIGIPAYIQGTKEQRAWVKKAIGFLTKMDEGLKQKESQEAVSEQFAQFFN